VVPDRFERLSAARLYLVCGALSSDRLDAALHGGVQLVQLRMKDAPPEAIVGAGRRFAELCSARNVPLILNDHPELVESAGADGVHLGQDDTPVAEARELLGEERIIGLSTHDAGQIEAAGRMGADYIGVGPVHTTPTKPGRPPVGAELVRTAAQRSRVPFFAIGGIDRGNIDAVLAAGASRVAVVRAIAQAEDPERAASELRSALEARTGVRVGTA
jgi:thiamine-phosphate pyrophosphorylase